MQLQRTKIVCTIGPASSDPAVLRRMVEAGMDVARLNFSHGTHPEKKERIRALRKISKDLDCPLAIVADLQGPKLRLGAFEGIREISKGEKLTLSLAPRTDKELPMQFDLSRFVKKAQRVFLNDGLVELVVVSVVPGRVVTVAQNSGRVSSHKGINIPDTHLADATFTKKDKEDALFALKENVDFLALSFVRNKQDLMPALALIKKINPRVKIIAKIEKNEAIENLEEIIEAADAVMVARGDLAIETAASHVPLLQERIISLCRQQKKPVIVATQMLESMIENPRPTRAETSDVANAVMNQVDGVMLSAESASGKYPVEAVAMMNEIIMSVEASHEFKHYIKIQWKGIPHVELTVNAIASSASTLAYHLAAPAIAVATASGRTAQIISSFRPSAHLIAATHDRDTANQLSLTWGVYPILVKRAANSDLFLKKIIDAIRAQKLVSRGNKIVVMGGTRVGVSGATDTIKVVAL